MLCTLGATVQQLTSSLDTAECLVWYLFFFVYLMRTSLLLKCSGRSEKFRKRCTYCNSFPVFISNGYVVFQKLPRKSEVLGSPVCSSAV